MRILLSIFVVIVLSATACKRTTDRGTTQRNTSSTLTIEPRTSTERPPRRVSGSNIVDMTPMGGVYEIPVEINGSNMDFIFDTGASSISISELEAIYLFKNGKLKEEDILGSMQFRDATGRISEGTTINLRSVVIGNREIKNVKASVVHNMEAPLLLGQSALAQFGKVTIDYKKNQLSFE